LILVATIALLIAAIARWPLAAVQRNPIRATLFTYIFLLILAGYDILVHTQGSSSYALGGSFPYLVQQIRIPIGKTAAWQAFATWAESLAR